MIQPITVRPNNQGFEIVAGARRYRAAQLAELFSVPARIVEIDDAKALEWQLVENSQRVDVHPYEEAQGFQRLLDIPGYDVAALVEKSGKSASHVYARLSLLQLIPTVAEAFLRLLIHLDYSFLEEVASHFANGDENAQQSDDEIVLAALDGTADEKLTGLALRLVLSDHIGIPHESQPDLLTEADQVFAPKKPKAVKAKAERPNKQKPTAVKTSPKKETSRKIAA